MAVSTASFPSTARPVPQALPASPEKQPHAALPLVLELLESSALKMHLWKHQIPTHTSGTWPVVPIHQWPLREVPSRPWLTPALPILSGIVPLRPGWDRGGCVSCSFWGVVSGTDPLLGSRILRVEPDPCHGHCPSWLLTHLLSLDLCPGGEEGVPG